MKKFIFLLFSFLQIFCLASIVNAQSGPVPIFSPSEGYVQSPQVVTITAPGATIYYTTNGSSPTTALRGYASSVQVYVATRTTIRAMAVKSGLTGPSLTKEYIPVIAPAAPTNAEMRLTQDCVWTASWASGSGAMHYYVLDSLGVNTYVRAPGSSLTVACPTGNPNGKKPVSVRACTYFSCSAPTTFVAVKSEFHSLIVNDRVTLAAADFSLQSVFTQLANQLRFANPTDPVTADALFGRMWDTQNNAPGTPTVKGPKCTGSLNGFQHGCRPNEGIQVVPAVDPSTWINKYQPIALVNRFDLRDTVTFRDCGEARIVYGLNSDVQASNNRNFIIFEAQLPNPTPGSAAGCLPIAKFWNTLSDMSDVAKRATELRNFYFNGIPAQSIGPVIHKDNYAPATGQIRTNQFMSNVGHPWVLKEFKVTIENGLSIVKPVSVKSNPFGELFRFGNSDTRALQFQNDFIANMDTLLTDRDSFFLKVVNDLHNNGESHASSNSGIDETAENKFTVHFNQGTDSFRTAVTNKLHVSGVTTLTADKVINRATAMTCGGCHQPSAFGLTAENSIATGVSWPDSLNFVHISETLKSPTQIEFDLSPALKTVFLPARKRDFLQYLNSFGGSVNATSFQKITAPVVKSTVTGKRSG